MQNTVPEKNALAHQNRILKFRLTHQHLQIFLLALFIGILLSSLLPPLQSPDEPDHIKRAYLLSKGQVLLESPKEKSSGGQIDNGLLNYIEGMTRFTQDSAGRVEKQQMNETSKEKWHKTTSFSPAPGTGYYFPVIYFPQALGLAIGESLDLTINDSYRLARLLSLAVSLAIIIIATMIFPTNFLTLGLLVLPVTVLQFVSASLDGTTTAIAILCISLFMHAFDKHSRHAAWASWLLGISLLLLATSRAHLLPLVAMPLIIFLVRKKRLDLILFLCITLFSLAWSFLALQNTVDLRDMRPDRSYSTGQIIFHYLKDPLAFFHVLWSTLMDPNTRDFYQKTFIGAIGWMDPNLNKLDFVFGTWFYNFSILFCIAMAALSIQWKNFRLDWIPRASLLLFSVISTLMVFFLLLATWTAHPATIITGVQGRYFLVPAVLLAYALSGSQGGMSPIRKVIGLPIFYLYSLVLCFILPAALIYRYFLQ